MVENSPSILTLQMIASESKANFYQQAEGIFFQTSSFNQSAPDHERAAFQKRWFGRYAELYPKCFLLALKGDRVVGYLAGCPDTGSFDSETIVNDISYYTPSLLSFVKANPAHFHVNVALDAQGQGIGRTLITSFETLCAQQSVIGTHVITGTASLACLFYKACGFVEESHPDSAWERLSVLKKTCV